MNDKAKRFICNIIPYIIVTAVAAALFIMLDIMDWQPSGADIWGHMYKAQVMYENLKQGIFYPLIDYKWYNAIQLYRYWPPLSYYVMAAMMFLTNGDIAESYRLVLVFSYLLGAFCWVSWGNTAGRRVLGTLFGIIWTVMPETIRIYMSDGNLPQIITTPLAAWIVFFLWLYVRRKNNKAAFGLYFGMLLMTVGHLMITAIMGVAAFIYLVFDYFENKDFKRKFSALCIMVTGIMSAGIWLIPALIGGGIGDNQSTLYVAPFSVSLNPFYRIYGSRTEFYFGFSVVFICIAGVLLAKGKKRAGFITALFVVFFTSPTTYALLELLPMSEMFWMSRFSPMLYAFFFAALFDWKTLKKKYCVLFMLLLILDISPVINLEEYAVLASQETVNDVEIVRENTSQRAAVMDLSNYGPYPSFGVSGNDGVNYTFGWAWQGAVTGDNIVMINDALEKGNYNYMFDRCIELGDDSVLVQKIQVAAASKSREELVSAADANGYDLVEETTTGYIFKKNTPQQFGVKTTYAGIAIGKYAAPVTSYYPAFTVGESNKIDEYTFEELKDYQTIFLTGFEYDDRENAQELVRELAEAGVRIVIDTTHMPSDKSTKQEVFLGVTSQQIRFTNRYPDLEFQGVSMHTDAFTAEDKDFSTGYIAYLDNPEGVFTYGEQVLTFCGYNDSDPNIYFIGLNLMYFACETKDAAVTQMLDSILMISANQTPARRIVEINVDIYKNKLIITSPEDNVNTTIAYQDIFSSDSEIREYNNLLVVDEGITEITLKYPYLLIGSIVSALGVISAILMWIYSLKLSAGSKGMNR